MKPVQIEVAMFSPRERWLDFSRAFQRTGERITIPAVASATIETDALVSTVADATTIYFDAFRALKRTAKVILSLRDDLCTGFK